GAVPLRSTAGAPILTDARALVARFNDREPFHEGMLFDVSYAAAVKLDIHRQATGRVEVLALRPGDAEASTLQAAAPVPAAPPAAQATGLDALFGQLATTPDAPAPRAVATVAGAAPAGRPAGLADHPDYGREEDRFRLVDDNGRVRSADEFD